MGEHAGAQRRGGMQNGKQGVAADRGQARGSRKARQGGKRGGVANTQAVRKFCAPLARVVKSGLLAMYAQGNPWCAQILKGPQRFTPEEQRILSEALHNAGVKVPTPVPRRAQGETFDQAYNDHLRKALGWKPSKPIAPTYAEWKATQDRKAEQERQAAEDAEQERSAAKAAAKEREAAKERQAAADKAAADKAAADKAVADKAALAAQAKAAERAKVVGLLHAAIGGRSRDAALALRKRGGYATPDGFWHDNKVGRIGAPKTNLVRASSGAVAGKPAIAQLLGFPQDLCLDYWKALYDRVVRLYSTAKMDQLDRRRLGKLIDRYQDLSLLSFMWSRPYPDRFRLMGLTIGQMLPTIRRCHAAEARKFEASARRWAVGVKVAEIARDGAVEVFEHIDPTPGDVLSLALKSLLVGFDSWTKGERGWVAGFRILVESLTHFLPAGKVRGVKEGLTEGLKIGLKAAAKTAAAHEEGVRQLLESRHQMSPKAFERARTTFIKKCVARFAVECAKQLFAVFAANDKFKLEQAFPGMEVKNLLGDAPSNFASEAASRMASLLAEHALTPALEKTLGAK